MTVASKDAILAWDQIAQQYPDLFKDDQGRPDFTPDRFGQLLRGKNVAPVKNAMDRIMPEQEQQAYAQEVARAHRQ